MGGRDRRRRDASSDESSSSEEERRRKDKKKHRRRKRSSSSESESSASRGRRNKSRKDRDAKKGKKDNKSRGNDRDDDKKDGKKPKKDFNPLHDRWRDPWKKKPMEQQIRGLNDRQIADKVVAEAYIDEQNVRRLVTALLGMEEEYLHEGYEAKTKKLLDRIGDDLKQIFKHVDAGEPLNIDAVPQQGKRKKLRHLFQAVSMEKDKEGQWTKSEAVEEFKLWKMFLKLIVSEESLKLELEYARKKAPPPAAPAAAHAAQRPSSFVGVSTAHSGAPRPGDVGAPPSSSAGQQDPASNSSDEEEADEGPRAFPSISGAALPPAMPPAMSSSAGAGPMAPPGPDKPVLAGEASRQAAGMNWMTDVPDSMAGMFGFEVPEKKTGDAHEIQRTPEEIAEFKKHFSDKPSLMAQVRGGEVGDARSIQEGRRLGKKRFDGEDAWGLKTNEQEALGKRQRAEDEAAQDPTKKARKMFDPQKDLPTRRQIDGAAFDKMLNDDDNSILKGRFGKSQVSTSFL